MAYNTKAIKKDVNGHPVPQYFNPTIDDFEPLLGAGGGQRVLLYDSNGSPLLTSANPGYIRAADGMIAALGALADAAQTNPENAASIIALMKGLLKQLQGTGTGAAPVQLTGRYVQEIVFHNGQAITDTNIKDVQMDISNLSGRKYIHVHNTLNQSVSITVLVHLSNGSATAQSGSTINVNGNDTRRIITASEVPALAEPIKKLTIRAQCTTAPTSGSLSTYLMGVQA